jgi:hypothetical protein
MRKESTNAESLEAGATPYLVWVVQCLDKTVPEERQEVGMAFTDVPLSFGAQLHIGLQIRAWNQRHFPLLAVTGCTVPVAQHSPVSLSEIAAAPSFNRESASLYLFGTHFAKKSRMLS